MWLQRGIDLPSLDVAYFTSLSYYMLLLFGLRGVMSLIFKEETIDETQIQKQQMTMGMGQMGQDPQKAFEQERAALDAVSPCCATELIWTSDCIILSMMPESFGCKLRAILPHLQTSCQHGHTVTCILYMHLQLACHNASHTHASTI